MTATFDLGKWRIDAKLSNNGNLEASFSSSDKSEIIELTESLTAETQWAARFSTEATESTYASCVASGEPEVAHKFSNEQHFEGDWLLKMDSDADGHLILSILHRNGGEIFTDMFTVGTTHVIEFERL